MPKPGPRTTRRYSPSFKATAVRLSQFLACACRMSLPRFTFIPSYRQGHELESRVSRLLPLLPKSPAARAGILAGASGAALASRRLR